MIVYSGKQYGNDFNNGDDALFGDSNRPKDENGFKIRPGLQGDKWNWRDVNKKTDFSQVIDQGMATVTYTPYNNPIKLYPVTQRTNKELFNNPNYLRIHEQEVSYTNGSFSNTETTHVYEILEDGLYYVSITGQFCWDLYGSSFDSNNSYKYSGYIQLYQLDNKGEWIPMHAHSTRLCGDASAYKLIFIQMLPRGHVCLPLFGTSYPNNCYCYGTYQIVKLG